MDSSEAIDTTDSHSPDQWLPVLLLLFVGSGCAALIYEIVWFQMLELFVGSSSVSIGVLLGTFMGGMCLGSFLLPRFISPRHHPLKVYALLEIAIGVIGLLLLLRPAARRPCVHRVGRLRCRGLSPPRPRREHLSAAADARDGRDASGRRAMGANDPGRRVVAGILLRRQHRGRGDGHAAGRLLPAARVRHERGHVCGRGVQLRCRRTRVALGGEDTRDSRSGRTPNPESRIPNPQSRVAERSSAPCMWRSPCQASVHWPPRSSGRAS